MIVTLFCQGTVLSSISMRASWYSRARLKDPLEESVHSESEFISLQFSVVPFSLVQFSETNCLISLILLSIQPANLSNRLFECRCQPSGSLICLLIDSFTHSLTHSQGFTRRNRRWDLRTQVSQQQREHFRGYPLPPPQLSLDPTRRAA